MANDKYEKIDFGEGQNSNTGDTIYDAFSKVNKAFEEIENDIESLDTKVDGEVATINNRIDDVVDDVNDVIDNEIANINTTITELSNDFNEFESETEQKLIDLETNIEGTLVFKKSSNGGVYFNNRTESNFNPVGTNSIDLSIYRNTGGLGASGNESISIGVSSIARGSQSMAIGHGADARGTGSIALGGSSAWGNYAFSAGASASASSPYSTVFGRFTQATSFGATVIGQYNDPITATESAYTIGSPLFIAGNGTSTSAKNNAYVLFNTGRSLQSNVANYTGDFSATFTDNSLISKKYLQDSLVLKRTANGGIVRNGRDESFYATPTGKNAIDLTFATWGDTQNGAMGNNSIAIGEKPKATGLNGTAIGSQASASGINSTAIGGTTVASGTKSTAIGDSAQASGFGAMAFGTSTNARGGMTTVFGQGTTANAFGSTVIGRWNTIFPASPQTNLVAGSPLFVVGNGTSEALSNAFLINNDATSVLFGVGNYNDDYSASFTQHSLVSKKYVDDNVASTVSTAISTILDGAPETFDTLKEIADWIENDGVSASELAESIALKVDKTEFATFKTANTSHINGVYDGLNSRINSLQSTVSANQTEMFGITGGLTGELATLKNTVNGHTAQITNNYNGLDSRLTSLNSTVSNNYSYLSGQIGPIGGRLNTIESNYTSLTNHINTFYSKGEIDGMLMGLESRVNNKITVDISTQLNTNVYPRLTTVENKFAGYYTIQQTNTLLENAGIINKTANGAVYIKGRNIDNLTQLGIKAVDLSDSGNTTGYGAIGENSFVTNSYTRANGLNSSAFGQGTIANGAYSVAMGRSVQITGDGAFGAGRSNTGTGKYSAIFGQENIGYSQSSLVIGQNNNPIVASTQTEWVVGAPVFIVGNGATVANKSNAYVLYNDGKSTLYGISSYSVDFSSSFTTNSLVSKKYVDDKLPNIIVDNDLTNGTTGFLLNGKYPNIKIGDYIVDTIGNKIYLKIKLSASASWVTLPFTFLQDEIS